MNKTPESKLQKNREYRKTAKGKAAARRHWARWARNPARKRVADKASRKYRRTVKAHRAAKKWREANPTATRVYHVVGNAVRRGSLKSQPCEICGALPTHAHHDDYSKPLKIRWLCPPHHKAEHMKRK